MFFEKLGFANHPFATTNADEEPTLSTFFVPPPFFDAVLGDSKRPQSSVILAPRGGGKTAQRRMVESESINCRFLAVTYDRFEFTGKLRIDGIDLQYHLRNLIKRILVCHLSYVAESPDLLNKLSKDEKRYLFALARSYLGDLTGSELQDLLSELKGLPEKFRDFWNRNVGVLEGVINFLLARFDVQAVDLPELPADERQLVQSYKYQLSRLLHYVRLLGFDSIYVLIDKIDETEQTGNDPAATYRLIQPLIRDLDLLGTEGYAFKFFLWDKIEPFFREDARPDRVPQYELRWRTKALKSVLSSRLSAFSEGKFSSFRDITDKAVDFDVDATIAVMANGSPRNLIRICERIFAFQAEDDPDSELIQKSSIDSGIERYCEEVARQSYGESVVREIQRVGRELFTANYAANDVFRISANAARTKIQGWARVGAVQQIGTVSVSTSNRPLHMYGVTDPALVRLIHGRTPIDQFIKDCWIPCKDCREDNLMDVNLFPDQNDPVCMHCGRNIF